MIKRKSMRVPKEKKLVKVTTVIPEDLCAKVDAECAEMISSRSDVLRWALVERYKAKP